MRVCGILSGTSCDAIEVCVCDIEDDGTDTSTSANPRDYTYKMTLVAHESVAWKAEEKQVLFQLINGKNGIHVRDICRANFMVGQAFALAVQQTLSKHNVAVQVIGSHGQTVWHEVVQGKVHSTLQIGEAACIAQLNKVPVVSDFRVADVACAGQGAPLVSILDACLYKPVQNWRALVNLGGIANVSFVASAAHEPMLSFDTGPANSIIDDAMRLVSHDKLHYDANGQFAQPGQVDETLLEYILQMPYFAQIPPKSTGRELFGMQQVKQWYALAKQSKLDDASFVCTMTHVTVHSIVQAFQLFWKNQHKDAVLQDVIVSGGGRKNTFLMQLLSDAMMKQFSAPVLPNQENGDAKEAMLFAFLAYLHVKKRHGNLPQVTGANQACILGKYTSL